MTTFDGEPLDSRLAKLALNARMFRYNKTLDQAADLFTSDPLAWQQLPLLVRDQSGIYMDARDQYRKAVAAGAVADDRGPGSEKEEATLW